MQKNLRTHHPGVFKKVETIFRARTLIKDTQKTEKELASEVRDVLGGELKGLGEATSERSTKWRAGDYNILLTEVTPKPKLDMELFVRALLLHGVDNEVIQTCKDEAMVEATGYSTLGIS